MRQALILGLKLTAVVSFCIGLLSRQLQAQTTADDQQLILELEKLRNDAIVMGDEKALALLLDDSFRGVTASGVIVNKFQQLSIFKSTNSYVTYTSENVTVNVHAAMAAVTGTLVGKTKSGSVIGKTRYLYIYLKKDGRWKIILSQETVVIKE